MSIRYLHTVDATDTQIKLYTFYNNFGLKPQFIAERFSMFR